MTDAEIRAELEKTGFPVEYHHFDEESAPAPPFIVYFYPGSENFSADNVVYQRIDRLQVEVYTDSKDMTVELAVEEALDSLKLFWNKTDIWIETEKLYEVIYETEVLLNGK